jgi:RAB protein geranylgeranyltransferase component A
VSLDISFTNVTGTTYNLASGDVNKLVRFDNANTVTVTVPANVFSSGNQVHVQQIGAGQVQMAQGAGVTITSTYGTGPDLRAQYSAATVICTSSNNFTVIGDIV